MIARSLLLPIALLAVLPVFTAHADDTSPICTDRPTKANATCTVPEGTWAVFRVAGSYPAALQSLWAATATDWFPSNPWRLRPGPSIVAVLDRAADFSTATCELWLPVERA